MPLPVTTVCLRCRVLVLGDSCELGRRHSCADLATAEGCAALAAEVWSAPRAPGFTTPESRAAAFAVSVLGVTAGFLVAGPIALATLPVLAGVGIGADRLARRQQPAKPRGIGAYLRPSASRRLRRRGVLEGDDALTAPFSGRRCIGYSYFFRAAETFGGSILLAGGRHDGFRLIDTDGAEVVAVPGAFRLATESDGAPATATTGGEVVGRFLGRFHSSLREGARPALPFDTVDEVVVCSGARVETYGRVVAESLSYRTSGHQLRFASLPQVLLQV